jgi:hypothetical protein
MALAPRISKLGQPKSRRGTPYKYASLRPAVKRAQITTFSPRAFLNFFQKRFEKRFKKRRHAWKPFSARAFRIYVKQRRRVKPTLLNLPAEVRNLVSNSLVSTA